MRLDKARPGGGTLFDHALAIRRQTGRWPEALAPIPAPPSEAAGLWDDYWELRSGVGGGPVPVSHLEMLAWAELADRRPTAAEARLWRIMDRAFLEALAETAPSSS